MVNKKALIIYQSIHHGNTLKVAQAMADALGAKLQKPSEVKPDDVLTYDLIGFGSGIYDGKHHKSLLELADKLDPKTGINIFIFSTAAFPFKSMHKTLKLRLMEKGFKVIGEFQCKGFMSYGFTKYFGGCCRHRPNEKDLNKAREFAVQLIV